MKRICKILSALGLVVFAAALVGCVSKASAVELSAPQNLRMERKVLLWDEVEHASGYVVSYGSDQQRVEESRCDLSFLAGPQTYRITVCAVGSGLQYLDSEAVAYEYHAKELLEHGYHEDGYEMTLLEDKSGYAVALGNAELQTVMELPCEFQDMPVKEIAEYAFDSETMSKNGVKGVYTLSADKTYINPYTGEGCNYMTEKFVLPPELEKISRYAFCGSYRLQSIEFPDGVREIGYFAFSGCSALKKIELPSSLNILGDGSFSNCLLEEITLNEGLEEIGYNAFRSSDRFDKYTDGVPEDIEIVPIRQGIEVNPHYYCVPQRFTEITIPDSVKKIGQRAFENCMNLSAVHVSAQSRLEEVGSGAFNTTAWVEAFPDGPVMLAAHVLYRYKGAVESGRYEIPSRVTTIAALAFNGVDVDEIVIPEGMTEISAGALGGSGAKRIVLPQSIITIGNNAFAQSENLQEIVLPKNIQTIGADAFFNCKSLQTITIPENVTSIGERAFFGCESLQTITIPESVISIGQRAFEGCKSLREIKIPQGVTSIERNSFLSCVSLEKVELPSTIAEIGISAFYGCPLLNEVVLPKSIVKINQEAFVCYGRDPITVYYEGTEAEWEVLKYYNVRGTPTASGIFANTVYFYSETEPTQEGNYWHYDQDGNPVLW